jgi:hypothetical protein
MRRRRNTDNQEMIARLVQMTYTELGKAYSNFGQLSRLLGDMESYFPQEAIANPNALLEQENWNYVHTMDAVLDEILNLNREGICDLQQLKKLSKALRSNLRQMRGLEDDYYDDEY